ncbi:pyridoxamine 5'-phosphate oxidase family protein [Anditalea andensis]|uniref:General stress protein FMN-binding split barrel domain-containing protein n=1 Tax=Anditalea andensis TaxID=1048983 RepID=A0A074LKW8_9BACT|nr:pyridoxamine 5'-phosphate oxidase family protein [Anditalea andensis]KEO74487.1 hypothetical protein EL17_07040 [Anditalea andensis]
MTTTNNQERARLRELIEKIELAMMVTSHGEELRARPMSTSQMDEDGNLWFFSNEFTAKTEEIKEDQQVNLSYADQSSNSYVSISGTATMIHDRAKIDELWSPILKAWFPNGKDDPDMTLIKVVPHASEYWDSSASKMVKLFNITKAIIKGETYHEQADDNENVKQDHDNQ